MTLIFNNTRQLVTGIKRLALNQALSRRFVMTSSARLEKAVEQLKTNPYYDKYAQKIAKLQQTSPEEFLQRIAAKEEEIKKKVYNFFHGKQFQRFFSTGSFARKYITTPIFYVNAVPHIGHLYTAVLADCVAKYQSMKKDTTVLLTTGTDEHGNKVQKAAEAAKLETPNYCTQVSQKFRDMCDQFDVGYTDFIRTTEQRHTKSVHTFWNQLKDNGHIYLGKYSGWYCTSDEAFLSQIELKEIVKPTGEKILVSVESGNPVEWTEEENYKFKLSNFQQDLKHWLKDDKSVQPAVYHKILSQWVEDERTFQDLSVSRPRNRVPWGISTPDDSNQNIYVWFDALVNYLTSLGYPDERFQQSWPPSVQVVGKDILKFHGIFWPAFLIAAGLEPPKTLLVHSHWTIDGEKMSKSKGNVRSPFEEAELFTNEGLRYYLLRDSVPHNDANYTRERVRQILNSELADNLGNLVNRCTGKAINPTGEFPDPEKYAKTLTSDVAENLRTQLENLSEVAAKHYDQFYVHHVMDEVMSAVQTANIMINHHKPWELRKKSDPESQKELLSVISLALECSRICALIMFPVTPELSRHLLDFLRVPSSDRSWDFTKPSYLQTEKTSQSTSLNGEKLILFRKLQAKN